MNGFPPCAFPFIELRGGWGAQSVNSTKIPMDTNQNPSKKTPKLKCPHAESDSDNDPDQTLFPKFILLESMEDSPITKLSPFIIEKTLNSFIKAKSVKKLINNTLLIEVERNFFSDLILKQKYFYNLKIKVYPTTP